MKFSYICCVLSVQLAMIAATPVQLTSIPIDPSLVPTNNPAAIGTPEPAPTNQRQMVQVPVGYTGQQVPMTVGTMPNYQIPTQFAQSFGPFGAPPAYPQQQFAQFQQPMQQFVNPIQQTPVQQTVRQTPVQPQLTGSPVPPPAGGPLASLAVASTVANTLGGFQQQRAGGGMGALGLMALGSGSDNLMQYALMSQTGMLRQNPMLGFLMMNNM